MVVIYAVRDSRKRSKGEKKGPRGQSTKRKRVSRTLMQETTCRGFDDAYTFRFLLRTHWSLTENGESGSCSSLWFHHIDLRAF